MLEMQKNIGEKYNINGPNPLLPRLLVTGMSKRSEEHLSEKKKKIGYQ